MSHTRRLVSAVLFSSLFLLGSCGGSKISNDTMVIGLECDYAPFNWTETNSSDNTLPISNATGFADGYDIQIAKRLSTITGKQVKIVKEVWDSLIPDIQNDTINMIIAGMTDTEERRQSIDFTEEYYRSEVVLLSKKAVAEEYTGKTLGASDLSTLLSTKNVVSQADTVEDDIINNFVTSYGCKHAAATETYSLAAVDVQNGSADFLVVEYPVAQSYVASMDGLGIIHLDQAVLGVDLSQLGVSIGIKKGNSELKTVLNSALAKITSEERNTLMTAAVERSSNN